MKTSANPAGPSRVSASGIGIGIGIGIGKKIKGRKSHVATHTPGLAIVTAASVHDTQGGPLPVSS
ncbi:hypothetical protein ACFC96_41435 [Streptomyces sp. NPDC055955]|uniref:hypothetical protein n=1 Tax=Streptomyces sp. NPDC055955 TaxID=3345665 RepID=UPI0035E05B03